MAYPQAEEIDERWALGQAERALLANKSGATRLGSAVLLKMFQAEGRFPRRIEDVSAPAVDAIARPRACRSIRPLPRSRPATSGGTPPRSIEQETDYLLSGEPLQDREGAPWPANQAGEIRSPAPHVRMPGRSCPRRPMQR